MSRSITLVRHGQASFGKSDYDRLSDLGHAQSRMLGQFLSTRGPAPDRVVTGALKRHRETAAELCVAAGWTLAPDVDAGWDELDHVAVINAYRPAYRNMLVLKADMMRTFRPRAAFVDMFTAAVRRWAEGEHDEDYPETFAAFDTRVNEAFQRTVAADAEHTLVVSSVGVIAWIVAGLLGAERESAWERLSMAVFNTGYTRLQVDKNGVATLSTFNEIGHLTPERFVTNH